MLKAITERVRREQAAATVAGIQTGNASLEAVAGRLDAIEAKLDKTLELLQGNASTTKKAAK